MPAVLLLAALLSQASTLEWQTRSSSKLIPSWHGDSIVLANDNDAPVCKVSDADEYEPCAWQDDRAAEKEKAERLAREEKTAKAKCVAGGCLIVRQAVTFAYTTYPPTYPPDWRCDCKAKVRPVAKGAPKK